MNNTKKANDNNKHKNTHTSVDPVSAKPQDMNETKHVNTKVE